MKQLLEPGTLVGARRWPGTGARPWRGLALALDDPRAWAQTLAFPGKHPDPDAVRAHVAACRAQGLLADKQPVLWEFGRVEWEGEARPYTQDVAEWARERAADCARIDESPFAALAPGRGASRERAS